MFKSIAYLYRAYILLFTCYIMCIDVVLNTIYPDYYFIYDLSYKYKKARKYYHYCFSILHCHRKSPCIRCYTIYFSLLDIKCQLFYRQDIYL